VEAGCIFYVICAYCIAAALHLLFSGYNKWVNTEL